MKVALDHAQSSEAETIADQVRFCEVPAPPFQESARGRLLQEAFTRAGLERVRADEVGNVIGERRGCAPDRT